MVDPLDGLFTVRQPKNRPFGAPHLARRLLKSESVASEIQTAIDLKLQRILEDSMSAYGPKGAAESTFPGTEFQLRHALGESENGVT